MWRHSPALLPTGRAGERLPALAILLDVDDRAQVRCWPCQAIWMVWRTAMCRSGRPAGRRCRRRAVDVVDPRCRIIIGTDERTRLRQDHCGG
jgi:hypothetical protein